MRWTARDCARLKRLYGVVPVRAVARTLRRTVLAVRSKAAALGIGRKRFWSAADRQYLREHYGRRPIREIEAELGRNRKQIYNQAKSLGIAKTRVRPNASWQARLRKLHAGGLTDQAMAEKLRCERHAVARWRRRLGLPDNTCSSWRRRQVARRTRAQCQAAGVKSLAEIRARAFRDYARRSGWPEDLRPRAVQILDLLYRSGPLTRKQIAEQLGLPWHGSRRSLKSNDREGSYLAHLIRRGLVQCLGRMHQVLGQGKGRSTCLYAVPIGVRPTPPITDH
jgi:hypothetical protein